MEKIYKYNLAGKELEVTFGKLAEQANGSCLVKYGETMVLVTATMSSKPREGMNFFPLSVDYEEKLYSVGKIPGGFIKREGRPSEKAILTCRLIDRPLRPLFNDGIRNDVQIIITVLSVEQDCSPEIAGMIGSSLALTVSDIPFNGPTGSVSVGYVDEEYIINPTVEQKEKSCLDLTVAGTEEAIMMVEAGGEEVSEDIMLDGILFAHEEIKKICRFIKDIREEIGKEKTELEYFLPDEDIKKEIIDEYSNKYSKANEIEDADERSEKFGEIEEEITEKYLDKYPDSGKDIEDSIYSMKKEFVRKNILEKSIRPDNRKTDEIRKITCETNLLPRAHGSGLFKRGKTQVMTIATLGVTRDEQIIDGITDEENKRYMHHYNFPNFSVGETGPMRGPGRREIGHGALAEKALKPMIPSKEEFPYTIRLVSEVLSSNGSTSQASVCGSSMSLMDAGVPIKKPVAGIAMGLMKEGENVKVLTDIQGLEDFLGDMDFKVAGTKDGITAVQMDIKIGGIDKSVLKKALEQAKVGRLFILDKMNACIDKPREELSSYAPKLIRMQIDPGKIKDVIGSGGKTINKIIDEANVKIDIEDDGTVIIAAENQIDGENAKGMIERIIKDVEVGDIYLGKVVRIKPFGAFVEVTDGKDGLLHISKISDKRIKKVEDVLSEGDDVLVKVIGIDDQGRISLSRQAALEEKEKEKENDDKKE
ncbi:MAG: polyribonucleotide nucleotidyltransferase [Eubacteriales bacterium]